MCDLRIAFLQLLDNQFMNTNMNTAKMFHNNAGTVINTNARNEKTIQTNKSCSHTFSAIMNPIRNTIKLLALFFFFNSKMA